MNVRLMYASKTGNAKAAAVAIARGARREAGRLVLFHTGFAQTAIPIMRQIAKKRGIAVDNEHFYCKGKSLFFKLGHPDGADLRKAEEFGKSVFGAGSRGR